MNPVVDKVAEALFQESVWAVDGSWDEHSCMMRDHYRRMARAAIEALGLTEMVACFPSEAP